MITVSIIGSGNLAHHLIQTFEAHKNIVLQEVFARNKTNIIAKIDKAKITSDLNNLKEVDVYIIAISDDYIADVSSQFSFENKLVVHTSGGVSISVLSDKNRKGIFYPLQSFSKNKNISFENIPICIEAENETDAKLLTALAQLISKSVYQVSSLQRKALHVAAVFANNFVNYLYQQAYEICQDNEISFEILKPLIQETAQKVIHLTPEEAQTGPAKRGNTKLIKSHEDFLSNTKQLIIYKTLTQSILEHAKKL
jgi:predicted short-subunit dehydrogenase-like oxidoreductase (DUF2520 family)